MEHQVKTAIEALHAECSSNGNRHLAAICEIAMNGRVEPKTLEGLQDQPRAVMAEMYGVGADGVAHAPGAATSAAAEVLRFAAERQEPLDIKGLLPALLQTFMVMGGGGSGPIKPQ